MNEPAGRVNFFRGQFLRTQDLVAEQQYHLSLHRRHQVGGHTWGIVRGLELIVEGDSVLVLPGLAIDGFGRDIVLTERREISVKAFIQRDANELEVWLTYGRLAGDPAPAGYAACDADQSELPSYRWLERPDLRYHVPDPAFADRRRPRGLTASELAFDPTQMPPDDPVQEWLVYLGLVRRSTPGAKPPFVVDSTGRPYAGLVGESVEAPSGAARLEIGVGRTENRDPAAAPDAAAPQRFAVILPGASASGAELVPLSVDDTGDTDLRGDVTVEGSIRIVRGTLAFDGRAEPPRPQAWSMYRATIDGDEAGSGGDELRIEMGAPTGTNRVSVGTWSTQSGRFEPCLTVADDCTVTVHGDLIVEEGIILGDRTWTGDGDARFSVQANAAALRMVESGIAAQAPGAAVGHSQLAMRVDRLDAASGTTGTEPPTLAAGASSPVAVAVDAVAAVHGSFTELAADLWRRDKGIVGNLIKALEEAISAE